MTDTEKKARAYRLPVTSTPENLETRFFTEMAVFLTFGDRILMSGYWYSGRDQASYFGAVYEFATDNHTIEGEIKLAAVSDQMFIDNGHAIAWALAY